MGDEQHPNQAYVDNEGGKPPRGIALPPAVSATAHAEHAQEGQSLGAADVGVATTGTGDGPEREGGGGFDPSEHTVEEVQAHLENANDAERDRVLAAEKQGKKRTTLLA